MAKSSRASVTKRNHANLRKKVFGPVVDARTERLAAKLQEIAAKPRPTREQSNTEEGADGEGTSLKAAHQCLPISNNRRSAQESSNANTADGEGKTTIRDISQ